MSRIVFCLLMSVAFANPLRADLPTATKYLEEARKLAGEKTPESREKARQKLELAELELDGVGAADKKAALEKIGSVRKELAAESSTADQKQFQRDLKRILDEAESAAGNLVVWPGVKARFEEFAKKPGVATALGSELDDAANRMKTFEKLYAKNKQAETVRIVEEMVPQLEASWAEKKEDAGSTDRPEARDQAVARMEREIESLTKKLAELPADHAVRKSLEVRVNRVSTEVRGTAKSGATGDVLRRLKDSWELDSRELTGWESESAGVSFAEYASESSVKMAAFGAPQSAELIKIAGQWLKNREADKAFQNAKESPMVAEFYGMVSKSRAKAMSRLESAAENLVAEASKTPITEQNLNAFNRLQGDLQSNLADSPNLAGLQGSVKKLLEKRESDNAAGEQAKNEWYATMTKQAAQQWPELSKKFKVEQGFDPQSPGASKGKLFKLTTDNLMGYRFKPGDFPFATTLNGHAIAAKFDPVVAGGIEVVKKKLGRDLGDSDDDGKWEIIFRVEGTTGKMLARKQAEGDLTLNGTKVGTYREEYSVPTEAAIVTIVAAHCGPLAVSADEGMIGESGEKKMVASSDSALTGSGKSGGYGILGSLLRILIGSVAGFVALWLGGVKPVVELAEKMSFLKDRRTVVCLTVAILSGVFGLYWLVSLRGIFAALSLIVTGVSIGVLSRDGTNLPEITLIEKWRAKVSLIGLLCLALTAVSLIAQGHLWVI